MAKSDMNVILSVADTTCEVINVDKNCCDIRGCISGVSCQVDDCKYHALGNQCTATHIDVKTENTASKTHTFCGTFTPLDTRL